MFNKRSHTYTHTVVVSSKVTYDDGSQKVVVGSGGVTWEGAERGMKELNEEMAMFSVMLGW